MPVQLDEPDCSAPAEHGEPSRASGPGVRGVEGLVLVDKPGGPSSFQVVRSTARALAERSGERRVKAGHAGTLDPAASGLLLVLVGRATRLARYLVGLDKRYRTEIELGLTTTTGDTEGDPLERRPPPAIERIAPELVGELMLPVPAASAVKIEGERAYKRHRRGEQIDMPLRRSTVRSAELLEQAGSRIVLELEVSSGTYIRAIAQHLGGHCVSIRRLAVGPFTIDDTASSDVLPPVEALPFLPRLPVDAGEAEALRHGRPIPCEGDGTARAVHNGGLVAVVVRDDGIARPETVLGA